MADLLSLRKYAERRGVALNAVQKAIKAGRITTVKDANGKDKIDPEQADRQWEASTDQSKQRHAFQDPGDAEEKAAGNAARTYQTARAMRESYAARLAKTEYELKIGKLIEADQVQTEWQKIVTTTKTRLLSVPSKVRARVPHLTLSDMATMEEEIRAALEEMSQGRGPEND